MKLVSVVEGLVSDDAVVGREGRRNPALDVIAKAGPKTCSTIEAASLSVLRDLKSANMF